MILISIASFFLFAQLFLQEKIKSGKKYFIIACGIILFLYAALRGHRMQIDIPRYVMYYENYSKYSFEKILTLYDSNLKDPTYYVTGWLFSRIFTDPQWWLAFIGAIYVGAAMFLIYKESENPLLSLLAFIALGYFEFSLSGLRQAIAMALTMVSYFFVKEKKFIPFIILVIIATLFHRSAIIFLIIYPIAHTKLGINHIVVFLVFLVVFFGFQGTVRSLIANVFEDTQFEYYAGSEKSLTVSGFIIQAAIFLFSLMYYPLVKKKYEKADVLYNLSFLGLAFQLFSSMIAEFFRVSMYFSIFNIILIPMAISVEKNSTLKWVETIAIGGIFLVYTLMQGIPTYVFFWQ